MRRIDHCSRAPSHRNDHPTKPGKQIRKQKKLIKVRQENKKLLNVEQQNQQKKHLQIREEWRLSAESKNALCR